MLIRDITNNYVALISNALLLLSTVLYIVDGVKTTIEQQQCCKISWKTTINCFLKKHQNGDIEIK